MAFRLPELLIHLSTKNAMQIPKRVFQLAKQPALSGFRVLAAKTIAEAGAALDKPQAKGGIDERLLANIRYTLRQHASVLQERMEHHFASYLERAMDTMYMDTRASIDEISADNLTLIEDDVVTRQIEIERLVMRLRDADQPSLGRLNLMIAQLHGDGDVRERENPFRPYLLARSLHEALRQCVPDEMQSKVLFDTLSLAMVHCLQGYYVAIEEVFESRGISSKLTVRPAALTRAQRDRLAWQKAAEQLIAHGPARGRTVAQSAQGTQSSKLPAQAKQDRMIPELQRLMQQQRQAPAGPGSNLVQQAMPDLQEMVWNVFNQPKAARPPRHDHAPARPAHAHGGPSALEAQLKQLQQARQGETGERIARQASAPLDLRAQLADAASSEPERVTIDLVSLLFESIVHDEQLPEGVRGQLGRLHVPFLRAAMQEPSMLHDAGHPARRLLDRIGTVATGITPEMACYPALEQQIDTVLDKVLDGFDADMSAFAEGQRQLDDFVAALLPRSEVGLARCIDTLGTVEAASARHSDTATALAPLLDALDVDPRICNFISEIWSQVLAHPANAEAASQPMLAELVWTAQEKTTLDDRALMVGMLPKMVKRVREGLAAAGMDEEQARFALDRLVMVHMDVLGQRQPPSARPATLDQLRAHFAAFDGAPGSGRDAVSIGHDQLAAALAQRGIRADLYTDPGKSAAPAAAEQEWLGMALPGAGFEIALDGRYVPARLSAVSPRGSLYLFSVRGQAAPATFTRDALLAAMQDETLRTVEHAPVFERAVESLMAGAEALSNA